MIKKRSVRFVYYYKRQHFSDIATRPFVNIKEDLGAFTISCTIKLLYSAKALCDLLKA